MSFDGLVTSAVTSELHRLLCGGKIEKIYQPEGDELVLHIHAGREKYKLYVSANSSHARIHLTEGTDSNPASPSAFCMLLRKHLQGGRISSIEQRGAERIVEIYVDTINELGFSVNKKLIVEIMGKHSNIIAVDLTTGRILDSIKRVSIDVNRYRQILPGQVYVYPPAQDKLNPYELTEKDITALFRSASASSAKQLVSGVQGLSPSIAEEFLLRASGVSTPDPDAVIFSLDGSVQPDKLFSVLHEAMEQLRSGSLTPVVYCDSEKRPKDFHVFTLSSLEGCMEKHCFDSVSEAISFFYANRASSNRIRQKGSDMERTVAAQLDKLYLKKQRLCEDLIKAENSDSYRLYGELLTANLHLIESGADKVTVTNYYDGQPLTIPLDPRFPAPKNAQRYYKKYAKAKTAVKEKNVQLEETNADLNYLESVMTYIQNAKNFEEIEALRQELTDAGYLRKRKTTFKEKKNKPAPYAYTSSDGFRILVGRNNKENDLLTLKMADRNDMWFHTKDIPGSHVIVFTEGRQITETAIGEAAGLAAYHSKGRQSENVPVDYTQVRYVKKPSGAKPGMVIFTDNRTIYVNPKEPENAAQQEIDGLHG